MNILVANIGSTSFKYRLIQMPKETPLARGGVERIGSDNARTFAIMGDKLTERIGPVADHGQAFAECLEQLSTLQIDGFTGPEALAAVGFKTVHAKNMTGVQLVDDKVLAAMDAYVDVTPAHNPPYLRAMRELRNRYPQLPLIAAFETGFHATIPLEHRLYAVPWDWHEKFGIQRWGFHGASHRYVAERIAERMERRDLRVISCHLGGSSSLSAIRNGQSIGNSMGMSPQSGVPHNNRIGDLDPYVLPLVMRETGKTLDFVLNDLGKTSGLFGISGHSNDVRDLEQSADQGNERAALALKTFVSAVRDYLGSYLIRLGGLDALVFTGGIGENSSRIRANICANLEPFGIALDANKNQVARSETRIDTGTAQTQIWVIPANEEIVLARQTFECINGASKAGERN